MYSLARTIGVCLLLGTAAGAQQNTTKPALQTPSAVRQTAKGAVATYPPALVESGHALFEKNCAFCHGRDAGGGETGPDLTASKLVASDVNGDKILAVVRNGRADKGMPQFSTLSDEQITSLVAFIHARKTLADTQSGGRRGVDVEDLQAGSADAGKAYFNGGGGCASCHSVAGDLAGVASRYQGLKLEQRFLYPKGALADATVTTPDGKIVTGKLAYRDEFTLGVEDGNGWYHSWPVSQVKAQIKDGAEAHADLLGKYTDDDIHNLMAYLQTLR